MHSVVLLCLAALIGVSSAATRGSVIIFPSNKGGDKLGGCDDCMTKATQLKLNPIYMNGIAYNAFAVSASVLRLVKAGYAVHVCMKSKPTTSLFDALYSLHTGTQQWLHHSV